VTRNIRNEIFVAIAMLLAIVFAILFAMLLSSTSSQDSVGLVPTATNSPIPPTASPTSTPSFTPSPTPTYTLTYTATSTPTTTHTATLTQTARPTVITLATRIGVQRTQDAQQATALPSPSIMPTNTVKPSHTPTTVPTASNNPTQTYTAPASDALGILPTLTPDLTAIVASSDRILPTRTPAVCGAPENWQTYTVKSGDTLFAIAIASGTNLAQLRDVNCLENINRIVTGDTLFVPREPDPAILSSLPSTTQNEPYQTIGCRDVDTQISSPVANQQVTGVFPIFGTSDISNFWYYKIEIRADGSNTYNFYLDNYTSIRNGLLGEVDASLFATGTYWLRLTSVNLGGGVSDATTCEIPVFFVNHDLPN
jgi:LysM repeat protein